MTQFIKRICEFIPKEEYRHVGSGVKGLYVLLQKEKKNFNVVYIGISGKSIRPRIKSHTKSRRKKWSHFTVFEVKNRVTKKQILELEAIFRMIYRKDKVANLFNKQKKHKRFSSISTKSMRKWCKLKK